MNLTTETLAIFLFLVPGFLSSIILNAVLVRKQKGNLPLVVEALAFSFLIYALVSIFTNQSPVFLEALKVNEATRYSVRYSPSVVIAVLALSFALPLSLGFLITNDIHMRLLRRLRVTTKTARATVWQDVFTAQRSYVIVNLAGGRRVFGWPMYYSNTPDEGQLYLYDAAWIVEGEDGEYKYQSLDIHGLFLVKSDQIESIEFTHTTEETARPEQEEESDNE